MDFVISEQPSATVSVCQPPSKQIAETFGAERRVAVVREITKKFEETVRGTVTEAIAHFKAHEPKGEFVIVVAGYDPKAERNAEADEDNEEEE